MRGDVELGGTAMKADGPDPSPLDTTSRRARLLQWSDLRSVPLRTILVTIAIVVAVYLLGKLLYRLRDVVLLMLVGGFIALVLNPLVVALQRWSDALFPYSTPAPLAREIPIQIANSRCDRHSGMVRKHQT